MPKARPLSPLSAADLAQRLGISIVAADLFVESEVIDLHVESYSFYRSFGYDPRKAHPGGLMRGIFVGQADLPRLYQTGINGATWIITANPLRPSEDRLATFAFHVAELKDLIHSSGCARFVRNTTEYREAREAGQHAAFLGVQGANALPPDPEALDLVADDLLRITLLHLTDSNWGPSSLPLPRGGRPGLSALGHAFVEKMNTCRIGVDLAHIHARAFWDAVKIHDPCRPLLVTHTGVSGAHQHWRNLDDDQLRAVAATGGLVGIMYHSAYLGDGLFSGKLSSVVRHIEHALSVIGPDHVALGSDWDGMICTPRDMPTCSELPRLVDALLKRGIKEPTVVKILGQNCLRVIAQLKGDA